MKKIYINRKPVYGPWGGGAKTVNKLWEQLEARGYTVVDRLQSGIDIIFCFDPRPNHNGEHYQHFINYRATNSDTKIVQRVGDLGTHSKPQLTSLVKQTLNISDYFIFPSLWAKEWIGFTGENGCVINNAPMDIFYDNRSQILNLPDQVSVVTHHWSTNPKKGFNLYSLFEKWAMTNNVSFNYIGQLPPNTKFRNYTKPISAIELAKELPKHHIYLTASEEEAGANHVVEALAAGLPVVYKDTGGSIVNYCEGYGENYGDFDSMISAFENVVKKYESYKKTVLTYMDVNDTVVNKYCDLLEKI